MAEIWENYLTTERRFSPLTIAAYRRDVRRFIETWETMLGRTPMLADLSEIPAQIIRKWMSDLLRQGCGNSTRARALAALKSWAKWLKRRQHIHIEALDQVHGPRRSRPLPHPVSIENCRRLIDEAARDSAQLRAVLLLLWGGGLRISEALAITRQQSERSPLIITGKGRKERIVPILPAVAAAITVWRKQQGGRASHARLFTITARTVQRAIERARLALGLENTTTPHALRHSFATHMLAGGANLREIQELLGHASLSTTMIYTLVENADLLKTWNRCHPSALQKTAK